MHRYCQGMNLVAGVLLLICGIDREAQSQVFAMLSIIVERVIPDYFAHDLIGISVDQAVLESLLHRLVPVVAQGFAAHSGMLVAVTTPWCDMTACAFLMMMIITIIIITLIIIPIIIIMIIVITITS